MTNAIHDTGYGVAVPCRLLQNELVMFFMSPQMNDS